MNKIKEVGSEISKLALVGFVTEELVKNFTPVNVMSYSGGILASIPTYGFLGLGIVISVISELATEKFKSSWKDDPNPQLCRSIIQLYLNCLVVGPLVTLAASVAIAGSSVAVLPALAAGVQLGAMVFVAKIIVCVAVKIFKIICSFLRSASKVLIKSCYRLYYRDLIKFNNLKMNDFRTGDIETKNFKIDPSELRYYTKEDFSGQEVSNIKEGPYFIIGVSSKVNRKELNSDEYLKKLSSVKELAIDNLQTEYDKCDDYKKWGERLKKFFSRKDLETNIERFDIRMQELELALKAWKTVN